MAKYRLSYLNYGGFKAVDLKQLECLKGHNITDLSVIDKFTTSFENMEELLLFLRRNQIIDDKVTGLAITIDKKENGKTVNKKIYNGEKILFKSDYNCLSVSFIYKWLSANRTNFDKIIKICDNYIEKYHSAYNRIDGSSYILSVFYELRALAIGLKNNDLEISNSLSLEYENLIEDFMTIEFFKIDKEKTTKDNIVRKRNEDGTCPKQYRNIHDFVLLMKKMDKDLDLYKSDRLIDVNNVIVMDNEKEDEHEEFLTGEDFKSIPNMDKDDVKVLTLNLEDGFKE